MIGSINTTDRQGDDTGADISAYVNTQSPQSQGPNVSISAAWQLLGNEMEQISDRCAQTDQYVVSEIVAPTESTLEFRTYYGARGSDLRPGIAPYPIIFSEEEGTLSNIELEVDASDEKTVVIAKGAASGTLTLVQVAVDLERIAESPFGRIETVASNANSTDDASLLDVARAKLHDSRPVVTFTAELNQVSKIRGIHYNLGDIVVARFLNKQYDVRLDQVLVYVGSSSVTERCILKGI